MTRRTWFARLAGAIAAVFVAPKVLPAAGQVVTFQNVGATPVGLKFHPDAFALVMEPIEWSDWQWTPEERAQAAARLANRIDAEGLKLAVQQIEQAKNHAVSALVERAAAMPPVDLPTLEEKARRYFARNYYIPNGRLSQ